MQTDRPIHVLKCILDSRFGGPHRRSYTMAKRLRPEGVETFFFFGDKGDKQCLEPAFEHLYRKHLQFARHRHAVSTLLAFLWHLAPNIAYLRRIIRSRRIDVVDVDGITNVVPALAAYLEHVPIVWYYNEPHVPRPIRSAILPVVAALASRVVVQGHALKEQRTGSRARLYRKAVVLYPAIDLNAFNPARFDAGTKQAVKEELGIPTDGPLIGMIGNHRWKGHPYFVEAAQRIKQHVKNAKFVIIGSRLEADTLYWKQLSEQMTQTGLTDDIVCTGFHKDIPRVLSALDVFVLPSIWESCPNVVLEAMAMQVPVVATDVGAVAELVLDGQTGTVVPPRDGQSLAQAVLGYLNAPPVDLATMTQAARKRVEREFSVDTIAQQQRCLYEALI